MRTTELKKHKETLLRKRDEILNITTTHATANDPNTRSGDWVDQSSLENDLHVNLALKQNDGKLLRAIEEAIQRIDAGTFGICLECDGVIASARLEAVPWTRVCIQCKEKRAGN